MSVYKENYKGLIIEIFEDEMYQENPLEESGDCFMISFHKRYGSNHGCQSYQDVLDFALEHKCKVYPVQLYDHSGLYFSLNKNEYPFNCPWDSMPYGFMLLAEDCGDPKPFLQSYQDWCNGECYGYVIYDENDNDLDYSCGYIGYKFCLDSAKESANYWAEKNAEDENLRIDRLIRELELQSC